MKRRIIIGIIGLIAVPLSLYFGLRRFRGKRDYFGTSERLPSEDGTAPVDSESS